MTPRNTLGVLRPYCSSGLRMYSRSTHHPSVRPSASAFKTRRTESQTEISRASLQPQASPALPLRLFSPKDTLSA
ncbi:hypothetical protein BJY59DRAFT_685039 [Rhodotorula toruloides]